MELHNFDEYKQAANVLATEGQRVSVDLRLVTLPAGYTIERAFEEINAQQLLQLPHKSQMAMRTLAQRLAFDPGWRGSIIVITRINNSEPLGLYIDEERLKIWALAVKPGSRPFTLALDDYYRKSENNKHLVNLFGMAYPPQSPRNFFIISIPLEDRGIAEKIAEESQMRLSENPPVESVKEPTGQERIVQYPPQDVPHTIYLVNEPGSSVYTERGSGADLFKIETMLLRDPENNR